MRRVRHARPLAEVQRREWLLACLDDVAFVLALGAIIVFLFAIAPAGSLG